MTAPSESALDHWRSLLAAIAPGVAVATVVQGLLSASAGAVIADGSFVTRPGWQGTVAGVIWFLAWTLSLGAAMVVMRGALIDAPVRATFALKAALRRWGVVLATILVVGGLFTALVLLTATILGGAGPLGAVVVILIVALGLSTVTALPLAVLAQDKPFVAASRAWELGVGKRWNVFFLGLGVWLPSAVIMWAQPRIASWTSGPVTAFLLTLGLALLSVIVIGFQASILARWYVNLDGNLDGVERFRGSSPRPDRWHLGGALLVAAALTVSAVTVANPWGVPVLASSRPAGEDPSLLIAGGGALLPDARRLTVSHDNSGPQVRFEICGRAPTCDTKLLTTFDKPGLMWEKRAVVVVGDGLAVAALVQQSGDRADRAALVVWHCPTVACERTTRTVVGPVFLGSGGPFSGGSWLGAEYLAFAVDADAQGRPQFLIGGFQGISAPMLLRCADAACRQFSESLLHYRAEVDGRWPELAGAGFDARHRPVLALASSEERPTGGGLRIAIANPPAPAPLVATVTCLNFDCQDRSVRRWHVPEAAYHEVLRPVSRPDGDLTLVTTNGFGSASSGYLIRCENHCA